MAVAIVTGASRGLGLATARALAGRGWSVAADARHDAALRDAVRAIAARGIPAGRVVAVPGDVTDPGTAPSWWQQHGDSGPSRC